MDFSLFLDPADIDPAAPNWILNKKFGEFSSAALPAKSPITNRYTALSLYNTTGAGAIYAAASGTLKVDYFNPYYGARSLHLGSISLFPLPQRVSVLLEVTPFKGMGSTWDPQANYLDDFYITGFRYDALDTEKLKASTLPSLRESTFPRIGTDTLDNDTLFRMFLQGYVNVNVEAGDLLSEGSASGSTYFIDFSVLTNEGPIDPSYFYSEVREKVTQGTDAVDDFLHESVAKYQGPLIDPSLTEDDVLDLSETNIFPWSSLVKARKRLGMTSDIWRAIRDNQKRLFEDQLLVKTGHYSGSGSPKYFEYDDNDRDNLFMLEAVTEFYLNFDEPWDATKSPAPIDFDEPALTGTSATVAGHRLTFSSPISVSKLRRNHHWIYLKQDSARPSKLYRIIFIDSSGTYVRLDAEPVLDAATTEWEIEVRIKVDFLPQEGFVATGVSGGGAGSGSAVVSLDSGANLRQLKAGFDVIKFYSADTSLRASQTYLITDFDDDTKEVTIEGDLDFSGTSAWKIISVPEMVLIDPFGPRFRGAGGTSSSPSQLDVPDPPDYLLESVNDNFDRVYIREDTSSRKTFQVTSVTDPTNILNLDGSVALGSTPTDWELPAGVGGRLNNAKSVRVNANQYDNYEGMLFVVHEGSVRGSFPWSSYTSRSNGPDDESNSSSKGNRRYDLISYRSGSYYINYTFAVVDAFALGLYDGTVEALRYFETPPVSVDTKEGPGGYGWGTYGKAGIRLHTGHADDGDRSSGSDGCMVSYQYASLRKLMLDRYQYVYRLLHDGAEDPAMDLLYNAEHEKAVKARKGNKVTSAQWNDKMRSFLYLIRPDEQPHT